MAHKVFISYAEEDKSVADAVCQALEDSGVRCWYAPRNVPYAVDYEEAIVDAISESRLMLLILSAHSNKSSHVKREVQNACREETYIPVLPFQIADLQLNKSLRYYIGSVQWLKALTPPLEKHLKELVEYVQQLLAQQDVQSSGEEQNPEPKALWSRIGYGLRGLEAEEEQRRKEAEEETEEAVRRAQEEKRKREAAELRQRQEEEQRSVSETRFSELNRAAEEKRLDTSATQLPPRAMMTKRWRTALITVGVLIAFVYAVAEVIKIGSGPDSSVNENRNLTAGSPPATQPSPAIQSSPTQTSSTQNGIMRNQLGMEFVYIPAGSFIMGADEGAPDERPAH